jgi:hypothetical protein
MPTVEDDDGRRYVLERRGSDSCRVRDPATGERRQVSPEELAVVDEGALSTAATAVPGAVRRLLTATPDERALGLLVELCDRGPLSAVRLLDAYDLCESDLHGLLGEFRAAGLVEPTRVAGERGYDATDLARDGVAALRDD